MNEQILEDRKTQAEEQFNALVTQRDQKEKEIKDIDIELNRLQGEYRLINDLLEKKVSPKADVIDVDNAVKAKK